KEETKKEEPKKEEKKEESKPASKYKDGTYSGTGKGYDGNITVSLTIQGDKITALSVTDSADDPEYLNDAKAVINSILSAQSTQVDSVSGATFTSNGIKAAAQAALDKAKN
ncbi:MAG: FMN-binding protein, partial [Peptostreptococcaceae bacterium]|nr:FMN-binding protein [Peptostreptococcaceae bacterium]